MYWQMDNNNPRKLIRETGNLYHWDIDEDWKVAFNNRPDSTSTVVLYTKTEQPEVLKTSTFRSFRCLFAGLCRQVF
ncbi:MAG: hypothetical protein IPO07_02380 [Haliscomenobacter sp.]|nr:hypothetical protein [Haliscomenobacter sp.]MBK9487753.1 hypothetical protein [Haliscomenobacter sp.]